MKKIELFDEWSNLFDETIEFIDEFIKRIYISM